MLYTSKQNYLLVSALKLLQLMLPLPNKQNDTKLFIIILCHFFNVCLQFRKEEFVTTLCRIIVIK